ncbi:hypothetical protein [Streptomyces flaveolus]|uniref:hypothetical protein n=1 Tax=Streptomyces flaveolus TaxID=67297 RepID=UPI00382D9E48
MAREALKAADAALTHQPAPVTTRAGHTHPAWDQRPMGDLSRDELAAQLASVRLQIRSAQEARAPLSETARRVIADLTHESQLRRALPWRDRAHEDYQREQAGATSLAARAGTVQARRTATPRRQQMARAALARADAVTDKIAAELRLRERLPDHPPYRPSHRGEIPDWVADRHAMAHPGTPDHWVAHLAERHRILARSLADRGHVLATAPPAWARPLGPPPPTGEVRRGRAGGSCGRAALRGGDGLASSHGDRAGCPVRPAPRHE